MKAKYVVHFLATCSLCCASFVAGALYASERKVASDNAAPAAEVKNADDPDLTTAADTIEIPPGRPAWIGERANYTGDVHRIAVASGPYATEKLARRALDEALVKATSGYVADQIGAQAARALRYDARLIKQRYVKPENAYHDVARYSVGPMHEHFALLEFGPEFRASIKARGRTAEAKGRLQQAGVVAGGSLVALAAAFVALRFPCRSRAQQPAGM